MSHATEEANSNPGLMFVAMMNVWVMWMTVADPFVAMHVTLRLSYDLKRASMPKCA